VPHLHRQPVEYAHANGFEWPSDPFGQREVTRLVPCPNCEGAGEWDEGPLPASSGALEPEYRQVFCSECEGTGQIFAESQPVTLDDLEELVEAEAAAISATQTGRR
jgi:hypothetical protein